MVIEILFLVVVGVVVVVSCTPKNCILVLQEVVTADENEDEGEGEGKVVVLTFAVVMVAAMLAELTVRPWMVMAESALLLQSPRSPFLLGSKLQKEEKRQINAVKYV